MDHAIAVTLIIWHFTKDKIQLKEVDNYHLYPIVDNDTPQLASDIETIIEIYNDIKIAKNEYNIDEMSFIEQDIQFNY